MDEIESIRHPELPDVDGGALQSHIPELLAKDTSNYLVEYGIRLEDAAVVFHFFSPKSRETWDPAYGMDKRLEVATAGCFDKFRYSAGFVLEMDSFYVIVRGLGSVPDPWYVVEKFFAAIDSQGAS